MSRKPVSAVSTHGGKSGSPMEGIPLWDPILVHDGQRWLMYALSTSQQLQQDNFFTKDNFIRGFSSHDLRHWSDLGTVLPPGFFGERICAGSLMYEDDRFYLFGSATMEQLGPDLLDQRIFLATSSDGIRFQLKREFTLEPDPQWYRTGVQHPHNGKMMFAWRDPYVFRDPRSRKYYLFICSGGKRWGTPPKVAVAEAERVAGPYRLLVPAAEAVCFDDSGDEGVPVWEMERVQVFYRGGKYHMMFSVWEHFIDPAWKRRILGKNGRVFQSAVIVLVSDQVTGPYRFDHHTRLVQTPCDKNIYGALLVSGASALRPDFVVGWHPDTFSLEVSGDVRLDLQDLRLQVV